MGSSRAAKKGNDPGRRSLRASYEALSPELHHVSKYFVKSWNRPGTRTYGSSRWVDRTGESIDGDDMA